MAFAEEDAHVLVEGIQDAVGLGAAALGEEQDADAVAQVESGHGGVSIRVGRDLQDFLEVPKDGGGLAHVGPAVGRVSADSSALLLGGPAVWA